MKRHEEEIEYRIEEYQDSIDDYRITREVEQQIVEEQEERIRMMIEKEEKEWLEDQR